MRLDLLLKAIDKSYGCIDVENGVRCWKVHGDVVYFVECNDDQCEIEIYVNRVKLSIITDREMENVMSVERVWSA